MLNRRDFVKDSIAFLASLGLMPHLRAEPAKPIESLSSEPALAPSYWCASGRIVIGPEPKTLLQIEPRIGKKPIVFDIMFGTSSGPAGGGTVVNLSIVRQAERISRCPAKLEGMTDDETWKPDVYAWCDGPAVESKSVRLAYTLNSRSHFRWYASPEDEIYMSHPLKLGVVATAETPVDAEVRLIGRNGWANQEEYYKYLEQCRTRQAQYAASHPEDDDEFEDESDWEDD